MVLRAMWTRSEAQYVELPHSAEVKMPPEYGTFKQVQRVQQRGGEQLGFEVE